MFEKLEGYLNNKIEVGYVVHHDRTHDGVNSAGRIVFLRGDSFGDLIILQSIVSKGHSGNKEFFEYIVLLDDELAKLKELL